MRQVWWTFQSNAANRTASVAIRIQSHLVGTYHPLPLIFLVTVSGCQRVWHYFGLPQAPTCSPCFLAFAEYLSIILIKVGSTSNGLRDEILVHRWHQYQRPETILRRMTRISAHISAPRWHQQRTPEVRLSRTATVWNHGSRYKCVCVCV